MKTLVLPMSSLPTREGDAFALLAQFPEGTIHIEVGSSWAAAAVKLAPRLQGEVTCGQTLSTVGQGFGWKVVSPTEAQLLQCAAIAVAVAAELPPGDASVTAFCSAWVDFFRLRLWEQLPAELSLRALRREGKKVTENSIAVMGQARIEYGLALYEDPRAFDAIWNGERYPIDGISVLADEEPYLLPAFQPFSVPPPLVTRLVGSKAKAPRPKDFNLATATMRLLTNVLTGDLGAYPFGKDATLELKRDAPPAKKTPSKKAKKK